MPAGSPPKHTHKKQREKKGREERGPVGRGSEMQIVAGMLSTLWSFVHFSWAQIMQLIQVLVSLV